MMNRRSLGLVVVSVLMLGMSGLPSSTFASLEQAHQGTLGVSLEEWQGMSGIERRSHIQALPQETRRAVLSRLKDEMAQAGRNGFRVKSSVDATPLPKNELRTRVHNLLWRSPNSDKSLDKQAPKIPQGQDRFDGVKYDSNVAMGYFASGDYKGNRFDTALGRPIPASTQIHQISAYLIPAPFTSGAFLDPRVHVKVMGPGTAMADTLASGTIVAGPGLNVANLTPPLHFEGPSIHVAFQDIPGTSYVYTFGISSAVYFYGTFRFHYVLYSSGGAVLDEWRETLYFDSGDQLPFYATTIFGGDIGRPIASFTGLFGSTFTRTIGINNLVPATDTMTVMGQGFHGENVKSNGNITEIPNRNFLIRLTPIELLIFRALHEGGNTNEWDAAVGEQP